MHAPHGSPSAARRATTVGVIVATAVVIIAFLPPLGVGGALADIDAFVWASAWTVWRIRSTSRSRRLALRVIASVVALALGGVTIVSLARRDGHAAAVPPFATARASSTEGVAPFRVVLDAADSRAQNPSEPLAFDWDIDGDGSFGDATTIRLVHVYMEPGRYAVRVKVTDKEHQSSVSHPVDVTVQKRRPHVKQKPPRRRSKSLVFDDVPDSADIFELTVTAGEIVIADTGEDELSRLVVRLATGRCEWHHVKTGDRFDVARGRLRFRIDAQHVGYRLFDSSESEIDVVRSSGRKALPLICRKR
jgi:PKD repeat protein